MPFSLRDTKRLFTYPAHLSVDEPSTFEMINSSFARTIEPFDLPVNIRSSLAWIALALAPTKLQPRRLALAAILSGFCTNLGLSSLFTSGALRHMRYIRQPPSPGLHGLSLATRGYVGVTPLLQVTLGKYPCFYSVRRSRRLICLLSL